MGLDKNMTNSSDDTGDDAEMGQDNPETLDAPQVVSDLSQIAELLLEAETIFSRIRHKLTQISPALSDNLRHLSPIVRLDENGTGGTVIEGIFDGQKMVGPDGKSYAVSANYASKSKLVEGDLLKLTITDKGAFIFKQVGPIVRRRLRGVVIRNPSSTHEWAVKVAGRSYRILTASLTYFRGHESDEAVILVPENGESRWAAVENILRNGQYVVHESSEMDSEDGVLPADHHLDDLDIH